MFALLVTLFLLSAKADAKSFHVEPRDLLDTAHELLDDLRELLTLAIDGTVYEIELYEPALNSSTSLLDSSIRQQIKTFDSQIDEFLRAGNEADVDIYECLYPNENNLRILGELASSNLKICADGLLKVYYKMTGSFKNEFYTILENVDRLESALDACESDTDCISQIIEQIAEASDSLPQMVVTLSGGYIIYVDTVLFPIEGCAALQTKEFTEKGDAIIAEIAECVNNLLG